MSDRQSNEELELRRRRLEERDPVVAGDLAERVIGSWSKTTTQPAGQERQEQARDREIEHERRMQRNDRRLTVVVARRRRRRSGGSRRGRGARSAHPSARRSIPTCTACRRRRRVRRPGTRRSLRRCRRRARLGKLVEDDEQVGVGGDQVVTGRRVVRRRASRTHRRRAAPRGSRRARRCCEASGARPHARGHTLRRSARRRRRRRADRTRTAVSRSCRRARRRRDRGRQRSRSRIARCTGADGVSASGMGREQRAARRARSASTTGVRADRIVGMRDDRVEHAAEVLEGAAAQASSALSDSLTSSSHCIDDWPSAPS